MILGLVSLILDSVIDDARMMPANLARKGPWCRGCWGFAAIFDHLLGHIHSSFHVAGASTTTRDSDYIAPKYGGARFPSQHNVNMSIQPLSTSSTFNAAPNAQLLYNDVPPREVCHQIVQDAIQDVRLMGHYHGWSASSNPLLDPRRWCFQRPQ